MRPKLLVAFCVLLISAGAVTIASRLAGQSAAQPIAALDESVVSFRVSLGLTDTEPRPWDGSLEVQGGELVALRSGHPRPGDQIERTGWKLATRRGPNFQRRAWEEEVPSPPAPYIVVPTLVVDVTTNPSTRVLFKTRNGDFEVRPDMLQPGAPFPLLGRSVMIERVPAAQQISTSDYQNDYPAIASLPSGEVWTAWLAYRDGRNEVLARKLDGKGWGPPARVTERPGDVSRVSLGRDGKGRLWAVWSAQVDGNWDLYGRRLESERWSAVERLTSESEPDIYPVLETDSGGNLWLAWQGFRGGKSDIFARRYDGDSWSAAEAVSSSKANDWEPAIAADRRGRVHVAWDTYDRGNYDVVLRTWDSGKWSEPVPVAATHRFEAHVSLACDGEDRLWAAWSESGMQWGKDSGFLVKKEATRLYQWRSIAVAVRAGDSWLEPGIPFDKQGSEEQKRYSDQPQLVRDGRGRVWLLFRKRTLRIRDTHNNTPAHRAAWELFATTPGVHWLPPVPLPFSQGRQDLPAAAAVDRQGNLRLAWATDNRDFEEFLFGRSEIHSARFPLRSPLDAPLLQRREVPELRTFPVHANEPADLERIRSYTIESGGKNYRIHRGDTHRHTEFSMDGNNDGSLADTYRYAMDAAELDYLMVSEHNGLGGPDVDYVNFLLQQRADLLFLPKRFVPLYGYERSLPYPNGHRNIVFARRGNPTLPIPAEEQQGKIGARPLYDYLRRLGGIAISHTSATNMGTDWRDNDPEVEPLVEIYQGDRVSAEYEGAPKAAHAGNLASAPGGFRPAGYVWNAWAKGYKLGVQVASDHLSAHISYACTIATDFTREGLLDAMRRRHSYGATDNIVLDYRLESGGKEYLQGDVADVPSGFKLRIKTIGTAPIRQIDVIRNNVFVLTRQPLQRDVDLTFVDSEPRAGESYYYVRLIQVDDQMAWSSPIWVKLAR